MNADVPLSVRISVAYHDLIERGRDLHSSGSAIDGLARGPGLTADERTHLRELATGAKPRRRAEPAELTDELAELLDSLDRTRPTSWAPGGMCSARTTRPASCSATGSMGPRTSSRSFVRRTPGIRTTPSWGELVKLNQLVLLVSDTTDIRVISRLAVASPASFYDSACWKAATTPETSLPACPTPVGTSR
ncbi:MAG: hypothetical protein ABIQ53_09965 [Terracoccus sp.]